MQPDVLEIAPDLRLVRLERVPDQALCWYQDPDTVWLVDGVREPYTPEHLRQMYDWLAAHGELWFIEVRDGTDGPWHAVGDATLCREGDNLPIVVGERGLRGRGIGRRVVATLCERARRLGWEELAVEIYDWNEGSRRCFAAAGFAPAERTARGRIWRRAL